MSLTINNVSTNKLTLKQKEGKTITFTYNVDISSADFTLLVMDSSGKKKIEKVQEDFDLSDIVNKKISINLTTSDLTVDAGIYDMELKTIWNVDTSVDITETIRLKIIKSLF